MYRILLVEDDIDLSKEIALALEKWGFKVELIDDFEIVLDEFMDKKPDVVLLDVNLPLYNGFYWCEKIRAISNVPLIFLSSRDSDMDLIMGINNGADDYITKPFSIDILVTKINGIIRRVYNYSDSNSILYCEDLMFDVGKGIIKHKYKDKSIELTKNEIKILTLLLKNKNRVVSRESLMMTLWDVVVSIINIYLFAIDIFKNRYSELIYLDFLVLFIIMVFFVIDYINFRNSYINLYNCIENSGEIDSYLVDGQSFEENLIKDIIENLKMKNNSDIEGYKQSLKELDEYIAKWVHEIKIPISSLSIITDRLSSIEDSLDIKNQVAKINFLVNSILYSSRSNTMFEDVFINKFNLEKLVKMSIKNNSFLLIKNNVEVSLNELENDVYTDSKCMSYILDQIINNAIKYSKEVGKIEFNSKKLENGVVLSIKDFGIGIDEEDISRVFDKGFTGKNGRNQLYKSTGMGMYFVKKMIDSLGHEIEVCSENGSYTIFNIYFYDISDYLSLDS